MISAIKQGKKIYMINQFLLEVKDKLTRKKLPKIKEISQTWQTWVSKLKRSIRHLSMLLLNCRIAGAKKKKKSQGFLKKKK